MKRYCKLIALGVSLFVILTMFCFTVHAAPVIPDSIKIGLYFTNASTRMDTALSSFNVSAAKGIELGFFKDSKFNVLCEEASSKALTIRKDSFFVDDGEELFEYDPASKSIPEGEKFGPYHIKIGNSYNSYEIVNSKIKLFERKGVSAYPVYLDGWQIWTGFYTDSASAQKDIDEIVKKKLGNMKYSVTEPSPNRIVAVNSDNQVILVYGSDNALFRIYPKPENDPRIFTINGSKYRGGLEVIRQASSDMTVINVVSLDEYLYGVVPAEVSAYWHTEAVKAQAVVARTYAIASMSKYSKLGFNLCATTYSQVYKGYSWENENSNKAVNQTEGKIVTYNGTPIKSFFFSSSGGRTENVENVWGGSPIDYLKSVEDKYETPTTWNYNWEVSYSADQIKDILKSKNVDIGDILGITVTKVSDAGRATELVVRGTKGEKIYTNEGCRMMMNPTLPSQLFEISTDADLAVKSGSGSNNSDGSSDTDSTEDKKTSDGNEDENSSTENKTQVGGARVVTRRGVQVLKPSRGSVAVVSRKKQVVKTDSSEEAQDETKVVQPKESKDELDEKITNIKVTPTTYKFTGKGWGHAVGMSQNGAKGMAEAGFLFDEIITHYYSGVNVE